MSEKASRDTSVREIVVAVAGPRTEVDTRESWLARAARRAGISFRQVKAIWYGEIKDRHHRSVRLLEDAARKRATDLAGTFENAAQRMQAVDPDFYSADIANLIRVARQLRGEDSSGNSGAET